MSETTSREVDESEVAETEIDISDEFVEIGEYEPLLRKINFKEFTEFFRSGGYSQNIRPVRMWRNLETLSGSHIGGVNFFRYETEPQYTVTLEELAARDIKYRGDLHNAYHRRELKDLQEQAATSIDTNEVIKALNDQRTLRLFSVGETTEGLLRDIVQSRRDEEKQVLRGQLSEMCGRLFDRAEQTEGGLVIIEEPEGAESQFLRLKNDDADYEIILGRPKPSSEVFGVIDYWVMPVQTGNLAETMPFFEMAMFRKQPGRIYDNTIADRPGEPVSDSTEREMYRYIHQYYRFVTSEARRSGT